MRQMLGRRPFHDVGFGLAVLLLGACGTDPPPATTIVRDSAGIQIVESSQRMWAEGEGWTVDPTPIVDLTTSGTGLLHEFYQVMDAARLPDGGIAVGLVDEVRLFSPEGEYVRTVGREGEGPGEFRYIAKVESTAPDSLLILDSGLRRASLFGPDRELVQTSRIDVSPLRYDRFAVLDHGYVGMVPRVMHREEEPRLGLHRLPVSVVTISRAGQLLDTLIAVPGIGQILEQVSSDVLRYMDPLFLRDAYLGAHGNKIIIGDAKEMQYQVVRVDGAVERIVRAEFDLRVTPEIFEAEKSAWLEEARSREDSSEFYSLPDPESRAGFRDLKVDRTGAVWLKEDRGIGIHWSSFSPQNWEVFDPNGVWLGQVLLPGRFTVFEIGHDCVLGVFRDQLDVEHPQVLALHR